MSEQEKPKSPWARRLENMPDLSEEDKNSLRALEALHQKIKPCLEPVDWNKTDPALHERVHEVHCGIKHFFNLAGFDDALKATILCELFGEVIGKHATSNGDATLTIALYSERIVEAARAAITEKQVQSVLRRLLHPDTEGRPN